VRKRTTPKKEKRKGARLLCIGEKKKEREVSNLEKGKADAVSMPLKKGELFSSPREEKKKESKRACVRGKKGK